MEEKVLWLTLPEGTEYQRVELARDDRIEIICGKETFRLSLPADTEYRRVKIAEDGKIGIAYAEEVLKSKANQTPIPPVPPERLIGGTYPYQKGNGTGYWYCKIKGGRDEFMYLYFGDLTNKDLEPYRYNKKDSSEVSSGRDNFCMHTLMALENKPKAEGCWIPVYEPSLANDGGIQYVAGEKVLVGLVKSDWEKRFKNYSPENGSEMASKTIYFLLGLRWLKDGLATIYQLSYDSSEIGHYSNSKNAKSDFEKTGEREFGGLYGFVGNTNKLVKHDNPMYSEFIILGGEFSCDGKKCNFANDSIVLASLRCVRYVPIIMLKGPTRPC